MKSLTHIVCLAVLCIAAGQVQAGMVIYGTRAAFQADHTGLSLEGFENVTAIAQVFADENIVPGISFELTRGQDPRETETAFLAAPGWSANLTQALGVEYPLDAGWAMNFTVPVNAVGFDAFQDSGHGVQFGYSIDALVSAFSDSGLLGSFYVTIPSGSGGFAGVFFNAGEEITRLTINNTQSFEIIDNVAFGFSPATVPEPGSLVMWGAGAVGLIMLTGRRKRPAG